MTKTQWIELFREAGLTDKTMQTWHTLFEARHPEDHQRFLEWLGIPENEISAIRKGHS